MGRQGTDSAIRNQLRKLRAERGLSQQDLARLAGLTRQTVNAVEAGRYVPNTAVALRLARALGRSVEDLFSFDTSGAQHEVVSTEPVHGVRRAILAKVGDRLVAHPLNGSSVLQEGFARADAVLASSGEKVTARLLISEEQMARTALVLGCDPSLRLLTDHLNQHAGGNRLAWLSTSSQQALTAVGMGQAHLAGSHLRDADGGFNVSHAQRALGGPGGLVVTLAAWEQGFVVAHGNPKGIKGTADLARPGVTLVNRELGAGCRQLLDELLALERVQPAHVQGYDIEVSGHLAVARAVAGGTADVGIALRAAAEVHDLDFIPLTQVRFDLVVPRPMIYHPTVSILLDALQTRALREELAVLPGYEVSHTGSVAADIPGAA